MQTVEHLEGTMTDSEEGHASEVNLPFIRDRPREKRHFCIFLKVLPDQKHERTPNVVPS